MLHRILIFSLVLFVAGCQSATTDPWATSGNDARQQPHRLIYQQHPQPQETTETQQQYATNTTRMTAPGGSYNGRETTEKYDTPQYDPQYGQSNTGESAQQTNNTPAAAYTGNIEPARVALLVPLSGTHKAVGEAMLKAAQMAVFDMGYDNFELLPRDTKGTEEGAREAAQSAVDNGAQLILGPLFSSSVKAVSPIAKRYNINMLAFSTDWSLAGGNTYVMGFVPFSQVRRIAEYTAANGLYRVGILAPDTEYGKTAVTAFNTVARRLGITTTTVMRFSTQETDISETVKIFTDYERRQAIKKEWKKSGRPIDPATGKPMRIQLPYDAVLLPVGGEHARAITNLLSYYDMGPETVQSLGLGLWDEPALSTEPGLKGAWFSAPSPDLRQGFEKKFKETYGYKAPRLTTLAYDATALAAVLAHNGQKYDGRPAFSSGYLKNPNGFSGLDGIFRFRSDGIVERGLAILEFADGEILIRDPAPNTFQQWTGQ